MYITYTNQRIYPAVQCGFNEFTYVFNSKNIKIMLLFITHQINDKIKKNRFALIRFGR